MFCRMIRVLLSSSYNLRTNNYDCMFVLVVSNHKFPTCSLNFQCNRNWICILLHFGLILSKYLLCILNFHCSNNCNHILLLVRGYRMFLLCICNFWHTMNFLRIILLVLEYHIFRICIIDLYRNLWCDHMLHLIVGNHMLAWCSLNSLRTQYCLCIVLLVDANLNKNCVEYNYPLCSINLQSTSNEIRNTVPMLKNLLSKLPMQNCFFFGNLTLYRIHNLNHRSLLVGVYLSMYHLCSINSHRSGNCNHIHLLAGHHHKNPLCRLRIQHSVNCNHIYHLAGRYLSKYPICRLTVQRS